MTLLPAELARRASKVLLAVEECPNCTTSELPELAGLSQWETASSLEMLEAIAR